MTTTQHEDVPPPSATGPDRLRRLILGGLAGFAAAALPSRAPAKEAEEPKVFRTSDRKQRFLDNEMDSGTPWVPRQQGNFDLADPVQNALAKLKITANLAGQRTYIPMLTRILIGREDLPGGLLLGGASMFTSVYLDPHSMEPVKTLKNPYNGVMMELEDYIFVENFLIFPKGGSVFIEEPQFANDSPDTAKPALIKRWGDELILFNGGVYMEPGKHQPKFTENTWRSPAADVMNPDVPLVSTGYNFTGINKAFQKSWTGYGVNDRETMHSLATGKKVHRAEDLPDFHKRVLVERHPDRL